MVQTSELDLVLIFSGDAERTQDVECIVDAPLYVFKVEFQTARLHYLRCDVCTCSYLMQLNFLQNTMRHVDQLFIFTQEAQILVLAEFLSELRGIDQLTTVPHRKTSIHFLEAYVLTVVAYFDQLFFFLVVDIGRRQTLVGKVTKQLVVPTT